MHTMPQLLLLLLLFVVVARPAQDEDTGSAFLVILDVGSSGTRAFALRYDIANASMTMRPAFPAVDAEVRVKPGIHELPPDHSLNTYTRDLLQLLRRTTASSSREVPVLVYATAGLRLVPPPRATALLRALSEVIDRTDARLRVAEFRVISGDEEASFMLRSVRSIFARRHQRDSNAVAVDLGGASCQLAFDGFVCSHLGYGRHAAHTRYLAQLVHDGHANTEVVDPCAHTDYRWPAGNDAKVDVLLAFLERQRERARAHPQAAASAATRTWPSLDSAERLRTEIAFRGGAFDRDACRAAVATLFADRHEAVFDYVAHPPLPFAAHIVARDNFVKMVRRIADPALSTHLQSGQATVADFAAAADACDTLSKLDDHSLCFELTYARHLLDALGARRTDTLHVADSIGSLTASWTLGAAIAYAEQQRDHALPPPTTALHWTTAVARTALTLAAIYSCYRAACRLYPS